MRPHPLQRRRLANFKANRRAFWSLWIFLALFLVTLCAEFVANDRPLLVRFQDGFYFPVLQLLLRGRLRRRVPDRGRVPLPRGPLPDRAPAASRPASTTPRASTQEAVTKGTADGQPIAQPGWMLWPPMPFSFNTINYDVATAPSPPDRDHWLGTDDQTRDVVARVIYGFRISVLFALVVAVISSLIGIVAGAAARASSAAGSTSSSSASSRSG